MTVRINGEGMGEVAPKKEMRRGKKETRSLSYFTESTN